MTEYVGWGAVPKSSSGGGELSEYLKLRSGNTYRIRPVFDPVRFFKYFHKHTDGKLRTAICAKPDTCPVRDRHPELKKPSMRFAAYVIDRADGKVKILESPQSVFRPIGSSFEATGKNPGSGRDGSDWQVKVSGQGLNTTYDVAFGGSSPLTADERALIKEALDGDMKKLQKLYKVDTPEEIEEKLFGDRTSKENAPAPAADNSTSFESAPTPEPTPEPDPASAPAVEATGDDFDPEW